MESAPQTVLADGGRRSGGLGLAPVAARAWLLPVLHLRYIAFGDCWQPFDEIAQLQRGAS
jgi:hypothetical protein